MDGIESMGKPVSLPLSEVPDRTPYGASVLARPGSPAGGAVRAGGNSAASALQRDEQEKQVGKDFESVLLTKLFEQVQASIEDTGFDDEDSGSQQVRGMFWLYLARDVADKGGVGLWKDIYQQIKQWENIGEITGSVNEEL